MSNPRFRLVQGKAIGERSTPTAATAAPSGINTPEPTPIQLVQVKQEPLDTSMDGYPMERMPEVVQMKLEPHQIKSEPMAPMGGFQQQQAPPQPAPPDAVMPGVTTDDKNVTKCVRFLKTLINLSNNEDPEQPDKAIKVKSLIQGVVYLETTAEEFTRNLQQVLKSQAQPHLLPFLQNTIPALRAAVRNAGEAAVEGVDPPPGYVFNNGRAHPHMPPPSSHHPPSHHPPQQPPPPSQHPQHLPPSSQHAQHPPPPPQPSQQPPIINRAALDQMQQRAPMMRPPPPPMARPMGMAQPGQQFAMRLPPDMPNAPMGTIPNMAQNQNMPPLDESPRKREGSLKSLIVSSDEVLQRITRRMQLSCSVEEEALVAISDALESNLREIIAQMAGIAEHRVESMRIPEHYVAVDDVKRQLRFLEDLDRQEEELRESREKDTLIRMSKNKNSGKETIEKAKEVQRQDAEAKRNRDANAAAIAALSSNRTVKNKWEGSAFSASAPRPRTVRVTTRDLHLMVNTDNRFKGTFIREKLSYGGPATDTTI